MFPSGYDSYKANGVAIIRHQEIAAAVMGYNAVSDQIISVRIQGRPVNITIIQIYTPTIAADADSAEDFYSLLWQTVDDNEARKLPRPQTRSRRLIRAMDLQHCSPAGIQYHHIRLG